VPKLEALVVNKGLLLPFCNSKEGGNKILVFVTINWELEKGLMGTKEKMCLNLKFVKGFSGAIRDGV
jgi:hypothetical protein